MSRSNENGISLATPPAIHVGPIVNPGTNETLSIVIPLSAQLTTIAGQKIEKTCKDCQKDAKQSSTSGSGSRNAGRLKNDKTKGCPFPGCIRYGRAFSRAHDLKRHIARHETRKDKLSDYESYIAKQRQLHAAGDGIASIAGGYRSTLQDDQHRTLWTDEARECNAKSYGCLHCKKQYTGENKLASRVRSHKKVTKTDKNVCNVCGARSRDKEDLIGARTALEQAGHSLKDQADKEDDFLLEEMLLLHKDPRVNHGNIASQSDKMNMNGGASSKIRCDYCSKTFKTKWTLSSHVAAHEGRFQFNCNQCGKKFVRKSHYEGHVRSHEAARPYVCEQCGKTFKELKHRREHSKRKHPTNQNAIQTLLDSIGPCAAEELPVDQTKFTLLMPVNFSV